MPSHSLAMEHSAASSPYEQLHSQYKAVMHDVRKYCLGEWPGELWRDDNSGKSAVKKFVLKDCQFRMQ